MKAGNLTHLIVRTILASLAAALLLLPTPVTAASASNAVRVRVTAEVIAPSEIATVDSEAVVRQATAGNSASSTARATAAQATADVKVTETDESITLSVDYN